MEELRPATDVLSTQETLVDWAVKWQKETFKESFAINWTVPVFGKWASHTHSEAEETVSVS